MWVVVIYTDSDEMVPSWIDRVVGPFESGADANAAGAASGEPFDVFEVRP